MRPAIRLLAAVTTVALLIIPRLSTAAAAEASSAIVNSDGCHANSLLSNDDRSTEQVSLPFTLNFFGQSYDALYINNNGNVTFNDRQSKFTPYTIDANIPPMIAPFFADVDTRGTGLVTYGSITFNGFPAFCVTWSDVGYFEVNTDLTNTFQLVLVSRPDLGGGAFDIAFNYGSIGWETGDASDGSGGKGGTAAGAGFSNGDGDPKHFYQLPGSLQPGAFLDDSTEGLVHRKLGSTVPGRLYFAIRSNADTVERFPDLYRDFPYKNIGYSFQNAGLDAASLLAGIPFGAVLRNDDLAKTFVDWDISDIESTLWNKVWRSQEVANSRKMALANAQKGGMCFGMALSAGRFDGGFSTLPDSQDRQNGNWNRKVAFDLPGWGFQPEWNANNYAWELLRMITNAWSSQKSREFTSSWQAQQEGYRDVTSGFDAFRNQLVSVMRDGKDKFDKTGKIQTASGARLAMLALAVPNRGGHAVIVYSAKELADGTLELGIWDNNRPNQPVTLDVHPDGRWSYPLLWKDESFSITNSSKWGSLAVFPLFAWQGLHFFPEPGSGNSGSPASIGSGAYAEVPAGSQFTASDASDRPVDILPVIGGLGDAGSTVVFPSGVGRIALSSAGQGITLRGSDTYMTVLPRSDAQSELNFDTEVGSASLGSQAADFTVVRGSFAIQARDASGISVSDKNAVTLWGIRNSTTAQITGVKGGQVVSATLPKSAFSGTAPVTLSSTQVAKILAKAAPKAQTVRVTKVPKSLKKGRALVLAGSVSSDEGHVVLQELRKNKWLSVAKVPVLGKSFTFRVAGLSVGKHVVRVYRAPGVGLLAAQSSKVSIVVKR